MMSLWKSVGPAVCKGDRSSQGEEQGSANSGNDRFDDGGNALDMSVTEYASTTWDFLFRGNDRTPKTKLPSKPADLAHLKNRDEGQLNVTWLGHSSLMINMDGYVILTDPVFERRVSMVGPARFHGDVPVNKHELPQIDVVIVSHDHYDHLSKPSVQFLSDRAEKFIVPIGVGARIHDCGVPQEKIVELNWWEEHRVQQDLSVVATPAQHFSGRGLTDRNKTLWASWVIESPFHRIFFSGDSGYFDGFRQIGEAYGPFDMTFIECGAYDKSWAQIHMFPEQTVQAHLDLRGNLLHPIHWGTFNLALHPWYDPMVRLSAAADSKNVKIATPMAGDTTVFGKTIPTARWWEELM